MSTYANAKQLMRDGQFAQAVLQLKQCLADSSVELLALIDIASCYYMLGDYLNCQKSTSIALGKYRLQITTLPPAQIERAALGLSKILEEQGAVAEALEIYEHFSSGESNETVDKIRAQELRLLSELNLREKLTSRYIACESLRARDLDRQIDLQNALMESDFILFGPEAALVRMKRLVTNPDIYDYERRLLFFNYLAYALKAGCENWVDASLFDLFQYFNCDPFEQALWDIYAKAPAASDISRSENMSVMCSIRYLDILQKRGHPQTSAKMAFYIAGLSRESKKLIQQNWTLTPTSKVLSISDSGIIYQGALLSLGKSENYLKIFRLLAAQGKVSNRDAIQNIFEISEDEYSTDRLRILVKRLNKKIESLTGIVKLIRMDKNSIQITANIRLEQAS